MSRWCARIDRCLVPRSGRGLPADELGQGVGRALSTGPGYAVRDARLPALGRVDAVQSYPLTSDVDGIAVYHAGRAGDVGEGAAGGQ